MWPRTEFDASFALAIAQMQMVLSPGDGEIKGWGLVDSDEHQMQMVLSPGDGEIKGWGLVDSDEQVMMAGIGTIHTRRRHPISFNPKRMATGLVTVS